MKKLAYKIAITSIILIIGSLSIIAQTDYSALKSEFRQEIQKKMKTNKVKGVSIALIEGDSIVWAEGFGFADVENQIQATPETQYRIGSITKLFTGTAVMQLNERSLINIDEPVNKFFPEFNIKSRFGSIDEITPRNVMTHTAGLPCDLMRGFVSKEPESYRTEIEYLNQEYTIYAPNTVHAYSNPGFNLLGCMVEEVSQMPYKEYIQNNIFDVLGMQNSCFKEEDASSLAAAYNRKGKLDKEIPIREIPAGEIKSTVLDLSKFVSAYLTNSVELLSKESQNEMTKVQLDQLYEGTISKMGLVWFIREVEGMSPIYEHGGATLLHRANMAICPEQNLGVVILTNTSTGNAVAKITTKVLKKAVELKTGEKIKKENKENTTYKKEEISANELNLLNGTYAFPGSVYEVSTKGNKLTTKLQGTRIDLLYIGNNEFVPVAKLLGFIPVKIKTNRFIFENSNNEMLIYQKDVQRNSNSIVGQRFTKDEISEEWKARVGKYRVVNSMVGDVDIFGNFELDVQNDILLLKAKVDFDGKADLQMGLGIISDDLAYVLGIGRQGGYSVAIEHDETGKELVRFSGYLLEKE